MSDSLKAAPSDNAATVNTPANAPVGNNPPVAKKEDVVKAPSAESKNLSSAEHAEKAKS